MRLTVLGGSAASPNAGAGCSGYLVEERSTRLVLDLGPGTLAELRRHTDYRTLDGVVISHLHPDHTLDLIALQYSLAYNPVRAPGPVAVWLPPGGVAVLEQLTAAYGDLGEEPEFFASHLTTREYDPAQPLTIGDVTVEFAPGVHYIPSWAMRLRSDAGPGDLAYTGDTGPAARLERFFAGATVLLAEATLLDAPPDSEATRGSLTAREAGELAARAGVETLILTHLWEEFGFDRSYADARSAFAGRLELARPGLAIEC